MKKFLLKSFFRLTVFVALIIGLFLVRFRDEYYYSITANTDDYKITWFYNQLNGGRINDNSTLFFGSSIAESAINDSLLNSLVSERKYFNCAVDRPCNALTFKMLEDVIVHRNIHPKRVYLCLKENTGTKGMYPVYGGVATQSEILATASQGNAQWFSDALNKVAWNLQKFLGIFQMVPNDKTAEVASSSGFLPLGTSNHPPTFDAIRYDSTNVVNLLSTMQKDIEAKQIGAGVSLHKKLSQQYLENIPFQDSMLYRCVELLQAHNISCGIILYPEFSFAMLNAQNKAADYYKLRYQRIDFTQCPIVWIENPAFGEWDCWSDLNHLQRKGADIFTRDFFSKEKEIFGDQ